MREVNVQVQFQVDKEGNTLPLQIKWSDGRVWEIGRVLHTCRSPDLSYSGIRYTVLIGNVEKYLYQDNRRWYVLIPA